MPATRRMILAGLAAPLLAAGAAAQKLSDRAITIIVPFSPGSGPDILARIAADELRQRWNQPVIVDNKPGASGNIGAGAASRAAPDGHTILLSVNTFLMTAALQKTLPYDPVKSFDPVIELAAGSLALAVHAAVPLADTKAFIAAAKSKPDEMVYSSPGRGTPHHMAMELFKLRTGAGLRHIPYSGTAGAVNDLIAGHVQAMFIPIHVGLQHAQAGKLRLLAIGSAKRSPLAPEVPTLAEQGIDGLDVDLWYGISAPAGTPRAVIDQYNAALNEILASARVRALLQNQGLEPRGGTAQNLVDLIARDQPRWVEVVKSAGIPLE